MTWVIVPNIPSNPPGTRMSPQSPNLQNLGYQEPTPDAHTAVQQKDTSK